MVMMITMISMIMSMVIMMIVVMAKYYHMTLERKPASRMIG